MYRGKQKEIEKYIDFQKKKLSSFRDTDGYEVVQNSMRERQIKINTYLKIQRDTNMVIQLDTYIERERQRHRQRKTDNLRQTHNLR